MVPRWRPFGYHRSWV